MAARDGDGARGGVYADRPGHGDVVLDLRRAAKDCADPRDELLVIERAREEVVAAAFERAHAVDAVRLGCAEDDHGDVAEAGAEVGDRRRVGEQREVRRLSLDDAEAVARQVAREKGVRFVEMERRRHASKLSPGRRRA